MWVREVRRSWERLNPDEVADVEMAIESIVDERPSFFKVNDAQELGEFAELFGCTVREEPNTRCYLVLSESDFLDYRFDPKADPALHPFLSVRHHELLADTRKIEEFARRALRLGTIHRLTGGKLKQAFRRRYPDDIEVQRRTSSRWKEELPTPSSS